MALPTPFETKRKKAPIGGLGRIQYLKVAVLSNQRELVSVSRGRWNFKPGFLDNCDACAIGGKPVF
jgi:hypothetical protein